MVSLASEEGESLGSDVRREEADLMADVNAHVHQLAERFAATSGEDVQLDSYMCECGSPECRERVPLSAADYEVCRRRDEPILAHGHSLSLPPA
jgi:hypothetical protein